jgi:hypothetical protein
MRPNTKLRAGLQMCVVAFVFLAAAATMPASAAQSADDSQSRPPVSKSDVQIVQRARQILNSPEKWNRADNRRCPATETKFSLYCALEEATYEVTHDFMHRGAAMQEARFVIDDDLAPGNRYEHRLMNYNNDPHTTFADVRRFFDFLQGRIEARLQDQEANPRLAAKPPAENVTQTDIAIIKKVQAILDSPSKWDKSSSQDCAADAKTFGLYCAFKVASIAVTGKPNYDGPAIREARQMISRAPHAARYSARLVDYNNDPTTTFEDLQKLLKTVETNLERRMAPPRGIRLSSEVLLAQLAPTV